MSDQLPEKQKGRKAIKYRGPECLNCKHPLDLSDAYCSYCGQLNTTKSLSLKDFFGEFIGSIITYDSKFRYTLKDLLFRPGVITRNYVRGQRLKYANPFRFYLSVSIIYFLIQGIIGTFTGENNFIDDSKDENTAVQFGPTGDNFKLINTPSDTTQVDPIQVTNDSIANALSKKFGYPNKQEIDSLVKSSIKKKNAGPSYELISESNLDTLDWSNRNFKRFELYYDFYKTTKIKNPDVALDSLKHEKNKYNRWAYQKNTVIEQIQENPSDFISYLLEKTPFFLFFFTPFYAFFFWLIYSKTKFNYIEHMIFIFHIFSFIFLAMIIALIPDTLLDTEIFIGLLFGIIGPFYFYKALRNFYKQNRLITLIKFLFLNIFFWLSASFGAVLFFAASAAMY